MLPRPPLSTRPATLFPYTPLFRSTRRGRTMRAFFFPVQCSQSVGMGKALADASSHAREVFQEVDDALGQKLFQLMSDGPEDQLTLTENAQPAIMANAIATLSVLEKGGGVTLAAKADYVAGHSLGEYSALCAAGDRKSTRLNSSH